MTSEAKETALFPRGTHVLVGGFADDSPAAMRQYSAEREGRWTILPTYLTIGIVLGVNTENPEIPLLSCPEGRLVLPDGRHGVGTLNVEGRPAMMTIRRPRSPDGTTYWVLGRIPLEIYNKLTHGQFIRRIGEGYRFRHQTDATLREVVATVLTFRATLP